MIRATVQDIDKTKFRRQPKALDENEYYKELSIQARYLYGIMLDKFQLSKKNSWVNENNEVYFKFKQKELGELMNLSVRQVRTYINELIDYNLLEKEKRVSGNIYFITLEFSHRKYTSGRQEVEFRSTGNKLPTINDTKYSDTEFNNNNNKKTKNVVVSQKTIDEIKDKTQNRVVGEDIIAILQQTGATEEELVKMVELMLCNKTTINNPIGWLIKAIEKSYKLSKALKSNRKQSKNEFHNFTKNNHKEYTNDELLKILAIN